MTPVEPTSTDPYRGLIKVSCIINSIHDYHQLLTSLLQTTKEVMRCDAGSLYMFDEATHELSWHVALGEKAAKLKEMGRLKLGQGIAGWVAENRKSTLVEDASNDKRFFRGADTKTGFQTRSVVCVPLLLGEKLVGVLQALNPLHKDFFDANDLEIFEAYGAMAATAIEKIRWQEATLQQQKMQQELEIAQEIQNRFLSQEFPQAQNAFDFTFHYQPAFQVGGDFYDIQETSDGGFAVIVGDVTGKGVPAALLMAQLLSEFRFRAPRETDPGKILGLMNENLSSRSARGMFATAWCAVLKPEKDSLKISQASAGHLAPICLENGNFASFEVPSGLPLGLMAGVDYPSCDHQMHGKDVLCVYTDGVSEGRNMGGAEYGTQSLQTLLKNENASFVKLKEDLLEDIKRFTLGTTQRDDVTFFICGPKNR
jgi:phosphoserine phosphatase RsbU/P